MALFGTHTPAHARPRDDWRRPGRPRVPESHEAIPPRLHDSLLVTIGIRFFQATCAVYGLVLLFWIWTCKDLAMGGKLADLGDQPVFYVYSIVVSAYLGARFVVAMLYRSTPDTGYRPSTSIVIPAFNEEDCIEATIDACFETSYPADKLDVIVVDDGSTDRTWERIQAACRRHPSLVAVRFAENRGKRAAMAAGIRRSSSEICVFVDSDSVIESNGLNFIMADFRDGRVGAVVGSAEILNKYENWITRMQQVRYYAAFRVIKASESVFGAVTCASGCFSAYRRSALLNVLPEWENQTFLGRPATYGDDRALTNSILPRWRVVYQSRARVRTLAPATLRQFMTQQLRWRKSACRETIRVSTFIWRKHPVASSLTYVSALLQIVSPAVLGYMLYWGAFFGDGASLYLAGSFVMAVLYSLFYGLVQRSPLWWYGMFFVAVYMLVLVWQNYWAAATLRNTSWGTRAAAGRASRSHRALTWASRWVARATVRLHPRSRLVEAILGVAMLPLTFLPIYLYSTGSRDTYMIWTHFGAALHSPAALKTDDMAFVVLASVFLVAAFALRGRGRRHTEAHAG
jgi:hyaluronan synthase